VFAVSFKSLFERGDQRNRELRARGQTAIIVSHDPRIIATFCDRAVLLEGGHIAMEDRPSAVAERYVSMLT
jgi:lipopolysaccharide transport system ATP-binding protein